MIKTSLKYFEYLSGITFVTQTYLNNFHINNRLRSTIFVETKYWQCYKTLRPLDSHTAQWPPTALVAIRSRAIVISVPLDSLSPGRNGPVWDMEQWPWARRAYLFGSLFPALGGFVQPGRISTDTIFNLFL